MEPVQGNFRARGQFGASSGSVPEQFGASAEPIGVSPEPVRSQLGASSESVQSRPEVSRLSAFDIKVLTN